VGILKRKQWSLNLQAADVGWLSVPALSCPVMAFRILLIIYPPQMVISPYASGDIYIVANKILSNSHSLKNAFEIVLWVKDGKISDSNSLTHR